MSKSVEWAIGIRDLVIGVLMVALGAAFLVIAALEGGNITGFISAGAFCALTLLGFLYLGFGMNGILYELLKAKP